MPNIPLNERIKNDFTYHTPTSSQVIVYTAIRATAKEFAEYLISAVPESRELSLALTNLEEAVFWANAGVARNTK